MIVLNTEAKIVRVDEVLRLIGVDPQADPLIVLHDQEGNEIEIPADGVLRVTTFDDQEHQKTPQ